VNVSGSESEDHQGAHDSAAAHERGATPELTALRTALETCRKGIWSWDLHSGQLTWSTQLAGPGPQNQHSAVLPRELLELDNDWLAEIIRQALDTGNPAQAGRLVSVPGERDEHSIEAVVIPVTNGDQMVKILGVCRDTTEHLRVAHEIHVRSRQQDALARLSERALIESDLQKFFDEVVESVAEILGVELVKILELLPGDSQLLLRAGVGWHPGLVGHALISTGRNSQAGYTLAAGRPVIVEDLASETRFAGQPILHDHSVVSGTSAPIAGRDGRAYGVLSAHSSRRVKFHDYDVSFVAAVANVVAGAIQRSQLDRRHDLMIRELRHRSGNLFAQLLALLSQTAKNSRNVADLVEKYEGRVLAIANTHRLITEDGWKSISLIALLTMQFSPYLDRISFHGADVLLEPDPTFGLSMAMHELFTNACQHGSLSSQAGRVDIAWSVAHTRLGPTLTLDWKETGSGTALKRSRRPGFGSRLISMVIERQLNGKVEQSIAAEGWSVRLTVPLTQDRWAPGASR
jgi:two-component sensor histidine kinase